MSFQEKSSGLCAFQVFLNRRTGTLVISLGTVVLNVIPNYSLLPF